MYSVTDYAGMIANRARTGHYVRALRETVRPGCVCLDLGAGTGFFAVFCCKLGAARVYAVEPNADALQVAREVAAANGCAERITFFPHFSTQIELPERADVIVSDLRGVLPLSQHHLPALADARRRFLAAGGVLIPRRDTLWAAVVESAEQYARAVPPGREEEFGVNLGPSRARTVHSLRRARMKPEHLLAPPRPWAELDYTRLEGANARGEAFWTVARRGTGHGLLFWFDGTLTDGVGFSNAPGQPELIYGQAFFPWVEPVPLEAGDAVAATLRADLVGGDYVWGWDSVVRSGGPGGPVKASFRQSTFLGTPLAGEGLRKRAATYRAALTEDGEIDRFILSRMDGATPLGDIARQTAAQFPGRFPQWRDALARVGDLAYRYGR